MPVRKIIFWLHLIAGVVAGIVILIMSATGVALAFEKEIIAWAERDVRRDHAARRSEAPAAGRVAREGPRRATGSASIGRDCLFRPCHRRVGERRPHERFPRQSLQRRSAAAGRERNACVHANDGRMASFSRAAGKRSVPLAKPSPARATRRFVFSPSADFTCGGRGNGRRVRCARSRCSTGVCAASRATGTGTTSSVSGARRF